MGVNRVIIGDEPVIDLSQDTVDPSSLLRGTTAHNSNGEIITGEMGSSGSPFDIYLGETVSTNINHQTNSITQVMTEGTVTTTFNKNNGVSVITSKIDPNNGDLNYTRQTRITKGNQVTKIRQSLQRYWAFDQNFADKNPATTITYPSGFTNSGFAKMHTNKETGTVTAGDWLPFLQETLKNYPYMVKKTGEMDYALNPNDYTKKMNGSASDYNNLNYNGGAFAWLNKIYMREDYSSNGESRRVIFTDFPTDGFYPVGFYDTTGTELEGLWLPMGYMDANGRTLIAGTSPVAKKTMDQFWSIIKSFSSRGVFLGGPIMNVLRDLEYMMFKTTDIQKAAGYGRCNAGPSGTTLLNELIQNGLVSGWKGTSDKKTMNKYFHSQVLGSYQAWPRDPYTMLINGKLKMSEHYIYDLSGSKLTDTGLSFNVNNAWPSRLQKAGNNLGSVPKNENSGSSSTGLCDALWSNTSGIRIGSRLGYTNGNETAGPNALNMKEVATLAHVTLAAAMMLLPPIGYNPVN